MNDIPSPSNPKQSSVKRRKVLKSIAVGGSAVVAGNSLPDSWAKPVVNAVILPAHAATTDSDSGAPGLTTTLAPTTPPPTTTPCVIAGDYCWVQNSFLTTISVAMNGGITITRVRTAGGAAGSTWVGAGAALNGAQGGTFSIQASRTIPDNPNNVRDYEGEVVCGSTSILATFDNPSNDAIPSTFTATQDDCRTR